MRRKLGIAALLPVVLGTAVAAFLEFRGGQYVSFYLLVDIVALIQIIGIGLSIVLLAWFGVLTWQERRERKLVADITAQAAEERRRFILRLDHELKNPLTAVRAGLVNITDSPSDADRREAVTSVNNQITRVSRLASDLRKLAELDKRQIERINVDLASLLSEAVDLVQEKPDAEQRRINVVIPKAPWPLPVIPGDRDLLFLAIYNLLDNAVKFTRPGDTIELRGMDTGDQVVIEVADTGPGIPEDEINDVWEELYRGKGARSQPGSGLGLALVRAIIERHGGQVALRSRVNQGSVFSIRLPTR